jgi:tyrosine-protein phosphatase YwqE
MVDRLLADAGSHGKRLEDLMRRGASASETAAALPSLFGDTLRKRWIALLAEILVEEGSSA